MSGEGYAVHIIEGDDAVRRALVLLTIAEGFEAVTYGTAAEYLARRRRDGPGCILLDLRLQGTEEMVFLERLGRESHGLPVIVMSLDGDAGLAARMLVTGATAFLEKPFSAGTLLSAIAAARRGHGSPSMPDEVAEAARRIGTLSPREREVLAALAAGRKRIEIAEALGISVRTVEVHRTRMLRRLDLTRAAEAVRMYLLAGLAAPAEVTPVRPATDPRPGSA